MIRHLERHPEVQVATAEFVRLLGFPIGRELEGRSLELADWARAWYADHGRPWAALVQAGDLEITTDGVGVGGTRLACPALAASLRKTQAESVVMAAVSAGPELEAHAQTLWRAGKPDEYYFLEVYGSAVVEQLITQLGAWCCSWAEERDLAVLPHKSPGYEDWSVGDQPKLFGLLAHHLREDLSGDLEVLESGALKPKKSQLVVWGLSGQADVSLRHVGLVPCTRCSFSPCQFRRATFTASPRQHEELPILVNGVANSHPTTGDSRGPVKWNINPKALASWARDRLQLDYQPHNVTRARFLFEGATCTSMGTPLRFEYQVALGSRDAGFPVLAQSCLPARDDHGRHTMCIHQADPIAFERILATEKPMQDRPLSEIITWQREATGPGCFCEPTSRDRLWGYALETIYFALDQREREVGGFLFSHDR